MPIAVTAFHLAACDNIHVVDDVACIQVDDVACIIFNCCVLMVVDRALYYISQRQTAAPW